ncbi:MAG: hypothetical protein JWO28_1443 [Hyphomicrobiales bacterium]|jgi:hypothetical protein|nr:hypothetical protein [Hyphomicrobiales bacterium]
MIWLVIAAMPVLAQAADRIFQRVNRRFPTANAISSITWKSQTSSTMCSATEIQPDDTSNGQICFHRGDEANFVAKTGLLQQPAGLD